MLSSGSIDIIYGGREIAGYPSMIFYHFLLMLTIVEQPQALVQGQFLAVPLVNIMPSYRACP
jgi:hypothetical protein